MPEIEVELPHNFNGGEITRYRDGAFTLSVGNLEFRSIGAPRAHSGARPRNNRLDDHSSGAGTALITHGGGESAAICAHGVGAFHPVRGSAQHGVKPGAGFPAPAFRKGL